MNKKNTQTEPPKRYNLRWCWLGLCIALILWLGSNAYYQWTAKIDEIDNFSASVSEEETSSLLAQRHRNHQRIHYASIAVALGSLVFTGRVAFLRLRK